MGLISSRIPPEKIRILTGAALAALAACLCDASGAWAQEPQDTVPGDTVFSVEEITVRVARPVATAGGAAALVAVLDSMRVIPSPTLADVLRRLPLIQIRENSRGEAQPNVRAMDSRRVAVLVDGVPLTLGWDNRTDLSIIPMTAAQQVTLVRGLSSVLHGPNAAGGVVLISIAEGSELAFAPEPFQLNAAVDNLGNTAAALDIATLQRLGDGDVLLRVGGGLRDRSDYRRPAGVPPARPGVGDERINSDLEYANAYVAARYQRDEGAWLSLSSFGFDADKGVPPELHIADPRLWRIPDTKRWVTAISGGTGWGETPLGQGDLEASIGLDFGENEIDVYQSLAYDSVTERELNDDRTLTFRMIGDHTVGAGLLRGALTLAETRHVQTLDPEDRSSTFRQRLWSLGLEVEQPLGPGGSVPQARLSLGLSVDGSDTPETGGVESRDPIWAWGARAGGTVVLGAGNVLLHGGVSRRVRFPALRELYSDALGRFVVNPALDPEIIAVAELGTTVLVGGLQAQAVAFHQRLLDGIVRTAVGDGKFQRQNRETIKNTGLELLVDYTWRDMALAGYVTIQDVQLDDATAPMGQRQVEYQPWISGRIGATVPLPLGANASGWVFHRGLRYCVNPDLNRDEQLPADTWLDLEIGRTFRVGRGPGLSVLQGLLAFDNVTDSAAFDQCGLPLPGRLLRLQIRLS